MLEHLGLSGTPLYMAAIILNMKLEARDNLKFDWGVTVSLKPVVHVHESPSVAKEAGPFRDALMRRMWADVMALAHHH